MFFFSAFSPRHSSLLSPRTLTVSYALVLFLFCFLFGFGSFSVLFPVMGQFHSSEASSAPEQDKKTDYYELLGIARGATDEE